VLVENYPKCVVKWSEV